LSITRLSAYCRSALEYVHMWPFKHKKTNHEAGWSSPPCPQCNSTNTSLMAFQAGEPGYVKVWRGERSLRCKCNDCGQDFYAEEPQGGLSENDLADEDAIDQDELRAAEEELKKQVERERRERLF
jgi:hypothetical protein